MSAANVRRSSALSTTESKAAVSQLSDGSISSILADLATLYVKCVCFCCRFCRENLMIRLPLGMTLLYVGFIVQKNQEVSITL